MRRTHILLLSALTLICCTALLAQKRAITEKDLFAFNWVGDPQRSPDGRRIAFTGTTSPDDLAKQRRAASREPQADQSAQRQPLPEAQRPTAQSQQQPGIPAEQTEGSTGDTADEHTSDVRVITKAV